jgi:type II secretory pathway component PulK
MAENRWIGIARRRRGVLIILAAWVVLLVALVVTALLAPCHSGLPGLTQLIPGQ